MRKVPENVLAATILALGLVASTWLYCESTRYLLFGQGVSVFWLLDQKTGEVFEPDGMGVWKSSARFPSRGERVASIPVMPSMQGKGKPTPPRTEEKESKPPLVWYE